jgi:hypothetical protein
LSAPKKGKDLSALKARLAKKAAEGEGGDAAAPAGDLPAPGEAAAALPAPGEVQKPSIADIPAPGEVKKPMLDIPPPGEVSRPAPPPAEVAFTPPAPARREHIADDPMSGGVAFDPTAGDIADIGGEIKGRSSIGLPIFAALIGIVLGAGLGWMGHRSVDSRERVDAARKKAEAIQAKVNEIEQTRASIALSVGEAQDALAAKEAEKAVEALSGLEATFVELGDLFGWQMAAMDPSIIKNIFDLAEANNSLQLDVGILKGWVAANREILAGRVTGPASFVVIKSPAGGAILGEYVSAICAEIPAEPPEGFDPTTLAKCEGDAILTANAYLVRAEIGGEVSMVPGDQAMLLIPDGPIYTYAIGATPDANAKAYFDIRMGRINEVLANMVKMKDEALEGISNYTEDPAVGPE